MDATYVPLCGDEPDRRLRRSPCQFAMLQWIKRRTATQDPSSPDQGCRCVNACSLSCHIPYFIEGGEL
jgi:hypothetical protein